jgi:protein SCO1
MRAAMSQHNFVERLVGRPLFWVVAIFGIAAYPVTRAVTFEIAAPPPVLGTLPEFAFVDQTGAPFTSNDVRGKVWVADFIFTRCPTICPAMTQVMAKVQHRSRNLGSAFRLVSFSIDPANDTPAVLQAYAEKHAFSPRLWSFVTGGSPEAIQTMVNESFKIAAGRDSASPGGMFHGSHFVLVDPRMQIRGYYDSTDAEAIDRLLRDVGLLIAREEAPAVATGQR